MIKARNIEVELEKSNGNRNVLVELVADSSVEVEEIGTNGATVIGLSEGDTMVMGSTCFTTEMEFGMLNSTGNWRF